MLYGNKTEYDLQLRTGNMDRVRYMKKIESKGSVSGNRRYNKESFEVRCSLSFWNMYDRSLRYIP